MGGEEEYAGDGLSNRLVGGEVGMVGKRNGGKRVGKGNGS